MAHLSAGVDDGLCTREPEEARTEGAVAGVICELDVTDGVTAYYDLFASTAAMTRAYASIRSSQGLTPNSARCTPARTRGETTWTWDETGERGRIACFRKNGQSWFVWSQPTTRAIGFARGDRVQNVHAFWSSHGLLRDSPTRTVLPQGPSCRASERGRAGAGRAGRSAGVTTPLAAGLRMDALIVQADPGGQARPIEQWREGAPPLRASGVSHGLGEAPPTREPRVLDHDDRRTAVRPLEIPGPPLALKGLGPRRRPERDPPRRGLKPVLGQADLGRRVLRRELPQHRRQPPPTRGVGQRLGDPGPLRGQLLEPLEIGEPGDGDLVGSPTGPAHERPFRAARPRRRVVALAAIIDPPEILGHHDSVPRRFAAIGAGPDDTVVDALAVVPAIARTADRGGSVTEPPDTSPDAPEAPPLGAFSISLAVADLPASRAFYEALGFVALGGEPEEGWLILRNGDAVIGLFHGHVERNTITFNPRMDTRMGSHPEWPDVREIQARLEAAGLDLDARTDPAGSGPGHILLTDPDGNPVLIDQF